MALDNSTINVLGVGLSSTLIDRNAANNTSEYELTGRLADGTPLHDFAFVQNGTAARLNLIEVTPEPATAGLLAAAAVVGGMSRGRRMR